MSHFNARYPALQSIPHHGIDAHDAAILQSAVNLLAAVAPEEHDRIFRTFIQIRHDPRECGPNAIACTAGQKLNRVAALRIKPSTRHVIEVAVTLSHEARHYSPDGWGNFHVVPHVLEHGQWRDVLDPIYARDAELRAQLTHHVSRTRVVNVPVPARPRYSFGEVVLGAGVAVGVAGLIGLALSESGSNA